MKKKLPIIIIVIAVIFIAIGGIGIYLSKDSNTGNETIPTEIPTTVPTETLPTQAITPIVEVTPTLIPTEEPIVIATSTPLPSPTNTPSPTPLPTSTPTPTVAPTATPIPVESLNIIHEEQMGDNVWYRYADDGTLYVTGSGKIERTNFAQNENLYRATKIVIEEGITHIGKMAFGGSSYCEEVVLPNSLIFVDEYAFQFCGGLLWPNGPLVVTNIDKERTEFHPMAFSMSGYDDPELMVEPTPIPVTPTPSPIPAPKAEEVDENNPKLIANVQMGDNVYFEFYDTGELYVTGSGRTWDFPMGFEWTRNYAREKYPHIPVFDKEYAKNIKVCYVADSITYLGNYSFFGLDIAEAWISPNTQISNSGRFFPDQTFNY